jgi:hypothetical protein
MLAQSKTTWGVASHDYRLAQEQILLRDRNKILELDRLWEVDKIAMRRRCIGKHRWQVERIVRRLPKRMQVQQGVERIVMPVVNSEGSLDWIV